MTMRISPMRMFAAAVMFCFSASASAHEVTLVASGVGARSPRQPQLAVSSTGKVHVAYGAGDAVYHGSSSDSGVTFNTAKEAFRVPNMSLGMRRGPRIVASQNVVVVTAIGGDVGKGRDGDVLAWRSDDAGATWSGPVRVNDAAASAREGLHAMTAAPDGSIWCVWLDLRDNRSELYASLSKDKGRSWGANIRVYKSPDGSVCECCHPSVIATDKQLFVMFRNSLAGDRDMYVTSSRDQGKSFSQATKLGHGTWTLDACPMDGGMLALQREEKIVSVWQRDNQVYCCSDSGEAELLLGRGQQPWIASNIKGTFIAWTTGRTGDLMLLAPGSNHPKVLAKEAHDPMVVASPDNGGVYCCWESKQSDRVSIVLQRLDEAIGQ